MPKNLCEECFETLKERDTNCPFHFQSSKIKIYFESEVQEIKDEIIELKHKILLREKQDSEIFEKLEKENENKDKEWKQKIENMLTNLICASEKLNKNGINENNKIRKEWKEAKKKGEISLTTVYLWQVRKLLNIEED